MTSRDSRWAAPVLFALCGVSCGDGASAPLALAPSGLTFKRVDDTNGRFKWDQVGGATEYVVFMNGTRARTIRDTTIDLDIGTSAVQVTVAAQNALGISPVSSAFPVLFDVRLRACGSITASVGWTTQGRTDTQVAVESPGQSTIACVDPTPRTSHQYAEVSACSTVLPAGNFGTLQPGAASTFTLLSRDSLGFLGEVQRVLTPPPSACLCVRNPANPDADCGPGWDGVPVGTCAQGFDLETGRPAAIADADIYLEGTPDATGKYLNDVRIVAPGGLLALKRQRLCDIDEAPPGSYPKSFDFYTDPQAEGPPGQTDSFIVRTKTGRYAKVGNECNCPTAFHADTEDGTGTGFIRAGFLFSWILAPAGSTTFTE